MAPSMIFPGRSTMRRIERAVMLLPHPLSPTMPRVAPGIMSKLTPSTAFTVPSSCVKYVLRFRTERSGLSAIGVGRVPEPIAQEVEGHDRNDYGDGRQHQPRRDRDRL